MFDEYGFTDKLASLAVRNTFTEVMSKLSYRCGKDLIPWGFGAEGLYDVSAVEGFHGNKVINEIASGRAADLMIGGTCDPLFLFYDYLLSISACYVEVPKYVAKDGRATHTYDKFLATKNTAVMAAWMGTMESEMQRKYQHRVSFNATDYAGNDLRFVKFTVSAKGNGISVPRNAVNFEKATVIPVFMLYAYIQGFKTVLDEGLVKFGFKKDNDTVREIVTTLNTDVMRRYYSDDVVARMVSGVDVDKGVQGAMKLPGHINRGYIKVPEMGSSIYDETGTRSINVARIVSMERVSSFDTEFIDVDLNSVVAAFNNCVDVMASRRPDDLKEVWVKLCRSEVPEGLEGLTLSEKLKEYVVNQDVLFTTKFRQGLHRFMRQNPVLFNTYTGKPVENAPVAYGSVDAGIMAALGEL